jgi:hypothetical protein
MKEILSIVIYMIEIKIYAPQYNHQMRSSPREQNFQKTVYLIT